jgi:hypothetical protein
MLKQEERYYSASGDSSPRVRFEDDNRTMVTDAVLVDTITCLSAQHSRPKPSSSSKDDNNGNTSDASGNSNAEEDPTHGYTVTHEFGFEECATLQFKNGGNFPWKTPLDQPANLEKPSVPYDNAVYIHTQESMREAYWSTVWADVIWNDAKKMQTRRRENSEFAQKSILAVIMKYDPAQSDIVSLRLSRRRVGVSQRGLYALVPAETAVGDSIVIVQGSELPFILRPSGGCFCYIGQCYVHGIMDREVWAGLGTGIQLSTIRIV